MSNTMLNATDPKIINLLNAWQANQALDFKRREFSIPPDPKTAKQRTKFIALDNGGSGHFLVNRETEQVYSIKAYGVPNLKKPRGTVEFLTDFINKETQAGREYAHRYWYALHPTQ